MGPPAYNLPMNPATVNFPLHTQTDLVNQQSQIDIGGVSKRIDIMTNLVPEQSNLDVKPPTYTQDYNLFNPPDVPDNTHIVSAKDTVKNFTIYNPTIEAEPKVVDETNIYEEKQSNLFTTVEQIQGQQSHGATNIPIIPPPPMFSNVPMKDSQTNAKSVLPPSVARRIGSHHPIIKPQMLPTNLQSKDIFIPNAVSDQVPKTIISDTTNTSFYRETALQPINDSIPPASTGSAFAQFNTPSAITESISQDKPEIMSTNHSSLATVAPSSATLSMFKPETPLECNLENQTATNPVFPSSIPHSEATAPPPMFFTPDKLTIPPFDSTSVSLPSDKINQSNVALMPLPTAFFNPSATTQSSIDSKIMSQFNKPSHSYDQNTTVAAKSIPEPPKLSGNLNYRMQKKRPQYYSGPIEGVGSISNNVKPTIPTLESSAFKGSLFTPDTKENTEQQPILNVNPAIISQQSITPPSFSQFDVSTPQMSSYIGTDHNTAFDMSRQTTDNYEIPKQESKGFGIIGSLKSKLSSLDINKIQNTVTTFFDPAYNDIKKEETNTRGFSTYDSNLEVFVPNEEQINPTYNESYGQYNYQHPYNYGGQGNQYYQNQSYDYGNQVQTYTTPDLFTAYNQNTFASHTYGSPLNLCDPAHSVDIHASAGEFSSNKITPMNIHKFEVETNIPTVPQTLDKTVSRISTQKVTSSADKRIEANLTSVDKPMSKPAIGDEIKTDMTSFFGYGSSDHTHKNESNIFDLVSTEPKDTGAFVVSQQLFNLSQPIQTDDLNKKLENLQLAREKEAAVSLEHSKDNVRTEILSNISNISTGTDFKSNSQPVSFFTNFPTQDSEDAGYLHSNLSLFESNQSDADSSGFGSSYFQSGNDYKETLKKEQEDSIDVPRIDSTAMPLFGLPNVFTESPISNIGSEVKSVSLYGAVKESQSDINIGESLTDDTANQNKPLANDSEAISDFNICETCREVNVTDDKDKDDLTTQLIENVTAPIQLLNPVIVPLTESSTNNDDADFEPNQCAEISHITEETIETIQVQTATELLDDEDEVRNLNTVSYGWNTTNSDTSFHPTEALLDHDFNFKIDPNAIGFFSNNSLFFEDMPNNASDEIKAEFKNTHEESPVFVPNIPTAPPAEDDDTKSDETGGIDVHSIEQDAKMDFPIYEEFVIEPSETDDDKIEYRERERSSEDPIQDVDTFTNRVERFKKMEETVDKADNVCNVQKNTLFDMNVATSPAITIASYFDTGNYAAETHYRNSISSPSSIFNVGSPNAPMRIPPGFEEEYKRRMSVLSSRSQDKKSDKDENILYIPETSTQTKPVITTTYSMISNKQLDITVTSTIQLVTRTQEIPHHDMVNLNPTIPEITTLKDDILENTKPLVFSSVSEPKPESADNLASQLFTKIEKQPKMLSEPKLQDNKESDKMKNLADPLTFFSSKDETPNVATDNNFNRLASYFTSPPKTDHGKSFFELSQSQNHYRHANYDTSTHDDKLHDIPNDGYLNNLIRDLTSSSNLSVNAADQIVRTVNYFTIEYDNDKEVKSGLNISEPDLKKLDKDNVVNGKRDSEYEESNMSDDKKIMTVVSKCKLCCNNDYFKKVFTLNKVALDTDFKVRTFMDNTDGSKDSGMDKKADMDNSKDDRGREVAVTFDSHEESAGVSTATESRTTSEYIPVKHHWFYRVDVEGKSIWRGFSATDSGALEDAFVSPDLDERTVVATDGGRFDVNIVGRLRTAVYWAEKPTNVRRCSWFYKGTTDARYVPYTEAIAEKLEEEYRRGITSGQWHRRLVLPSNSLVVMHGPAVMVHLAHQDPPAPVSLSCVTPSSCV
ncbi:unnamed protein product [Diatraea saccharalis]|uniref:WWE domain-containing protein n=1 Tax=Diatraea saccharalis TaxID=40085 RepID=A0A9N9WF84_9NEOP|nr:unnamed protein product [Diatraea saccharalis]